MAEWSFAEHRQKALEESLRLRDAARAEERRVAPRIPVWLDLNLLEATVPEPGWRDQANCKGLDQNWFFPERGGSNKDQKAVCAGCVVRYECLSDHLDEEFGVFGGTSERERKATRKALRAGRAA